MKNHNFKRLRKLRLKAKLTQVGLYQKSGVRQGLISDLETGTGQRPGYDVVRALADALGISSDELVG